jgi:hypothetical protein
MLEPDRAQWRSNRQLASTALYNFSLAMQDTLRITQAKAKGFIQRYQIRLAKERNRFNRRQLGQQMLHQSLADPPPPIRWMYHYVLNVGTKATIRNDTRKPDHLLVIPGADRWLLFEHKRNIVQVSLWPPARQVIEMAHRFGCYGSLVMGGKNKLRQAFLFVGLTRSILAPHVKW